MATGTDVPLPLVTIDEAGNPKAFNVYDAVRSVRGMLRPYAGGRLLSEELIEERRREEATS